MGDRNRFWRRNWLGGLLLALAGWALAMLGVFQGMDRWVFDSLMAMRTAPLSERVAVVAIDEKSLAQLGAWPWSRRQFALLAERLQAQGALAVAPVFPLPGVETHPALPLVMRAEDLLNASAGPESGRALAALREAESLLDGDRALAQVLEAGSPVILPLMFSLSGERGAPVPEFVRAGALGTPAPGLQVPVSHALSPVSPVIFSHGQAFGHVQWLPDEDGRVRFVHLALALDDHLYPSLVLQLIRRLTPGGGAGQLQEDGWQGAQGFRIPTDNTGRVAVPWQPAGSGVFPPGRYPRVSFVDALAGRGAPDGFRGKVVLVGVTVPGEGDWVPLGGGRALPLVDFVAEATGGLLAGAGVVPVAWARGWQSFCFLLVAGLLAFGFPRLSPGHGVAVALLASVLGGVVMALGVLVWGFWVPLASGVVTLLLGLGVGWVKSAAAVAAPLRDVDKNERRRRHALSLLAQGQLDRAHAGFLACERDDTLKDPLYQLVLAFERNRQFDEARQVLRELHQIDPEFRDVAARYQRSLPRQGTPEIPASAGADAPRETGTREGDTAPIRDGVLPPGHTLGRYVIDRQLGKGAMGIIYEGRDPKVGRTVAIKTLSLAKEFDRHELEDVKHRFFREAETAGRLIHPNIVTIYDAGEEGELAYIAMEFLKGQDLARFCQRHALLTPVQVVEIIAQVADALGYAHINRVVHRDIKPANIMFDTASGMVKVMDFGIARVTDSNRTKTGMVLGSPTYMSPEQLAGRRIDGRSDLYSLGVTLFQLLAGRPPFVGDTMAQLMYAIANAPAPDLRTLRPEVPASLAAVVDRALMKDLGERYQRAEDFARDLRECLADLQDNGEER